MAIRTGKIYLCKNIKLDKNYKNVLDYTENEMLTLCSSSDHLVTSYTDCSFIREGSNQIDVPTSYSNALKCNYIAFQNPDYSLKWFFAFIDNVEYKSQGMTRITFTVDEHATWFDYWTSEPCFVIREHVNDDTPGLHTVPEGLEVGEPDIKSINYIPLSDEVSDWYVCFTVTNLAFPTLSWTGDYNSLGGVFTPLYTFAVPSSNSFIEARTVLDFYKSSQVTTDAIINVYPIPADCVDTNSYEDWTIPYTQITTRVYHVNDSYGSTTPGTIEQDATLSGSFVPKNNKLFTWPFSYFHISNNAGIDVPYRWEEFPLVNNVRTASYRKIIVPSASLSAKIYFDTYKNFTGDDYGEKMYSYGIPFGKSPICAWTNDSYTNWLTQNGLNMGLKTAVSVPLAIGGALVGGGFGAMAGIAGAVLTAGNAIAEVSHAQKVPDQAHGDLNGGDIMYAYFRDNMTIYKMTPKPEYSAIIDDYFTRYGYKVNSLKVPEFYSRVYWNYIQIAQGEDIGFSSSASISVPTGSMETINRIYSAGTTVWHNHANIGDFSLNNTIVPLL